MGLYDRPYYQDEPQRPFSSFSGRTMIVNLMIINAVVYFVDVFFFFDSTKQEPNGLNYLMAASIVTMIPCIVLFFVAQKQFVSGLTLGGVKG